MMVGEHDWYFDMGEKWREMFGPDRYSFDHKGVHFVVLNSVVEKDFWTAKGYTPEQRMNIVAGLDDGRQSRFEVGEAQRDWLKKDLAKVDKKTPLVVFSHSPLYKYYEPWNFWTDDAEQVQALLLPFATVTRDPRPHAPAAHQPDQEHQLPRHALDRLAVAVRAAGPAEATRSR